MRRLRVDRNELRCLALLRVGLALVWLQSLLRMEDPNSKPPSDWLPVSLGHLFSAPPAAAAVDLIFAVAVVATLSLALGWRVRTAGPVSFAAGTFYACLAMSFGKLGHGANAVSLVFLVLLFSDWGALWSVDRRRRGGAIEVNSSLPPSWSGWPVWVASFALALPYFSAGMLKLLRGHFLAPGEFRAFLAGRWLLLREGGGEGVPWIEAATAWALQHPFLPEAMAYGGVAFELFFWVGLLSLRLRVAALGAALCFHAGITIFGDIHFGEHAAVLSLLLAVTTWSVVAGAAPVEARVSPKLLWREVLAGLLGAGLLLGCLLSVELESPGLRSVAQALRSGVDPVLWLRIRAEHMPLLFAVGATALLAALSAMARAASQTLKRK